MKRMDLSINFNAKKWIIGAGLVALPLLSQSAFAQTTAVDKDDHKLGFGTQSVVNDGFARRVYGGIGVGKSWLEPDTSDIQGTDTNKRVSTAGQVMLGVDVNKWISVEGHAASLGEAGLFPSGTVGYQTFGISALAYAGKNRDNFNRRGFSAFGRVGYGSLKNDPSPEINFEQLNASHVLFGAGLEYATRMGIGVRAEVIAFDSDARYGQMSLLYRLGKRRESQRDMLVEAPKIELDPQTPDPIMAPVAAIAVAPIDNDNDGVLDSGDSCLNTAFGIAVTEDGCDMFNGVIEGVKFHSGSSNLTPNARVALNNVVETLRTYPDVKLTIMAHTDSEGNDTLNKKLSRQRAISVARYLVQNGVPVERLKAFGFGEANPIDSNETPEGRSRNRRVEFKAEN